MSERERRIASDRDKLHYIFDTVDELLSHEYGPHTVEALLRLMREATGVCRTCRGSGIDGDPPDPAGDGGWKGPCPDCKDGMKNVWMNQDGELI